MINLFNACPACHGPLIITECKCAKCNLQMRGEFSPGLFGALSPDQQTFIRVFLNARGNLTEVEKELGISYPTIRNKLDEINKAMGIHPESQPDNCTLPENTATESRKTILQKVADGELTASEAQSRLDGLKGERP